MNAYADYNEGIINDRKGILIIFWICMIIVSLVIFQLTNTLLDIIFSIVGFYAIFRLIKLLVN